MFHKWSEWPAEIPQGLKPLNFAALFGTRPTHWVGTPVVPFHEAIDETRSSVVGQKFVEEQPQMLRLRLAKGPAKLRSG